MVLVALWHRVLPCLQPHRPHPLLATSTPTSHCHPATPLAALLISAFLALGVIAAGFLGQALVLHTYLAATNQTTLELQKGASLMYMRPYYLTHQGPHETGVTGAALLMLLWRHFIQRQPPPMPFNQGLPANLKLFFLAPKPYNYTYAVPYKELVEYRQSAALPRVPSHRFTGEFVPAGQDDPEAGGGLAVLLPDSEDDLSQLLPRLSAWSSVRLAGGARQWSD